MTSRSYGQYCGIAAALDAIGDRWALLVVRELLDGPKRYTDLCEGLPGISTDVLAARLRQLDEDGIVARRRLGPPVAAHVYELTGTGRQLEPILLALARWGLRRLAPDVTGEFRPSWLAVALRSAFRGTNGALTGTVDFVVDGERLRARITEGALTFDQDFPGPADLVIEADDAATLLRAATVPDVGPVAIAVGELRVTGDHNLLPAIQQAFSLRGDEPAA